MISNKEDLILYLKEDFKRNLHCDYINPIRFYFRLWERIDGYLAYHYLKALRKYEYSLNCQKNKGIYGFLLFKYRQIVYQRIAYRLNISILPNTVGYGLYLPHIVGGGIIISCKSMGNYCTVNANVLIGKKNTDDEKPVIGNSVEINTGAVVFGKITVGDDAKIAPNTVVFKDVPENAVVSGVPAQLIKTGH